MANLTQTAVEPRILKATAALLTSSRPISKKKIGASILEQGQAGRHNNKLAKVIPSAKKISASLNSYLRNSCAVSDGLTKNI